MWPGSVAAQKLHFDQMSREVIEARLKEVKFYNRDREAELKRLFTEAGCRDHLSEQTVTSSSPPNLVCILPGESEQIILVGAHFDRIETAMRSSITFGSVAPPSAEFGQGVADNWTGASLLPSLLQSLTSDPRHHTYVFVAFTDEEKGMVGSHFYVSKLSEEEKRKIDAMVNIDTLGLSSTKVWVSRSDVRLAAAIATVAKAMQLPVFRMDVDQVGNTDSASFVHAKVPVIDIHSVTQETLHILHSRDDKLEAVKLDDYYDTYRLAAAFLAYLDNFSRDQPEPPITLKKRH